MMMRGSTAARVYCGGGVRVELPKSVDVAFERAIVSVRGAPVFVARGAPAGGE